FASVFASSRMFGAFVLVPTFVLGNTLGFALTPSRRRRVGYIAVGVLAFLAPAVLERVGGLPPSYLFGDGAIHDRSAHARAAAGGELARGGGDHDCEHGARSSSERCATHSRALSASSSSTAGSS